MLRYKCVIAQFFKRFLAFEGGVYYFCSSIQSKSTAEKKVSTTLYCIEYFINLRVESADCKWPLRKNDFIKNLTFRPKATPKKLHFPKKCPFQEAEWAVTQVELRSRLTQLSKW